MLQTTSSTGSIKAKFTGISYKKKRKEAKLANSRASILKIQPSCWDWDKVSIIVLFYLLHVWPQFINYICLCVHLDVLFNGFYPIWHKWENPGAAVCAWWNKRRGCSALSLLFKHCWPYWATDFPLKPYAWPWKWMKGKALSKFSIWPSQGLYCNKY